MPFVLQMERASNNPIRQDEFDFVVSKSNAINAGSANSFRIMHNRESAGFSIDFVNGGTAKSQIAASLSYANPAFGNIVGECIENVLKVADYLGAQLKESFSGKIVTSASLPFFTDRSSEFILYLKEEWDRHLLELNRLNRAPLEFPVQGQDSCSEYFCLNIKTESSLSLDPIEMALGLTLKRSSDTAAACYDKGTLRPHCKLNLDLSNNRLQLQPYYWKQHFPRTVTESFQVADLLLALFGGDLSFFETPLDARVKDAIVANSQSLGIDFALWLGMKLGQN